jgi:hypothetical protein
MHSGTVDSFTRLLEMVSAPTHSREMRWFVESSPQDTAEEWVGWFMKYGFTIRIRAEKNAGPVLAVRVSHDKTPIPLVVTCKTPGGEDLVGTATRLLETISAVERSIALDRISESEKIFGQVASAIDRPQS